MEQTKSGTPYSADALERIVREMRPGGLLVPVTQEDSSVPAVGPRFLVFRLYSEMGLEPADPEVAYWDALREADVIDGIGEMSWINANLSEARPTNEQIHWDMVTRFIAPDLLPRITNRDLQGAASVVFNRIG